MEQYATLRDPVSPPPPKAPGRQAPPSGGGALGPPGGPGGPPVWLGPPGAFLPRSGGRKYNHHFNRMSPKNSLQKKIVLAQFGYDLFKKNFFSKKMFLAFLTLDALVAQVVSADVSLGPLRWAGAEKNFLKTILVRLGRKGSPWTYILRRLLRL